MTHPENPFGDFENDFKNTEKAPPGSAPGRVPEATYKLVLTTNDPGEGKTPVDHEIIVGSNTGTKGFKLFCEIIEPESVVNKKTGEAEETKGRVLEHVFWITKNNLPYVKRDIATILGRELESLDELPKLTWAGRTLEGVVGDEEYKGIVSSRIRYINPWTPPEEGAEKGTGDKKPESKTETKKVATPAKPGTAASKTGGAKKPAVF